MCMCLPVCVSSQKSGINLSAYSNEDMGCVMPAKMSTTTTNKHMLHSPNTTQTLTHFPCPKTLFSSLFFSSSPPNYSLISYSPVHFPFVQLHVFYNSTCISLSGALSSLLRSPQCTVQPHHSSPSDVTHSHSTVLLLWPRASLFICHPFLFLLLPHFIQLQPFILTSPCLSVNANPVAFGEL